ncbi:alpha-amylase family glycosyl hydrolase [Croceibacterium ferulae]|uniref:alpha-amylase family glycosyl hydrolase n=1 Tax=Croceibacterium ferulae TaxID=1854641 RepID=UPI000EAB92BD|nr:alpha-amylase family glycosyl hydrolase [Croceibacterium ferulae]
MTPSRLIGSALPALALLFSAPAAWAQAAPPTATAVQQRLPQDEVIYFVLPDRFENGDRGNDRGGLSGDRSVTGFDPADTGFYHGGDLKGLLQRLDYLQDLGVTALWVGPIFRNKPVQGPPGRQSAGYHGYWITDFEHVDPHFGTDADFAALVEAAHERGLKVYMDIVVNHTADVISYRECDGDNGASGDCTYRGLAEFPYITAGRIDGEPINPGFKGDADADPANWAQLTDPAWAYQPYIPAGEEAAKSPAWLNDPLLYHNRGNTSFAGESSTMGDFFGLDDVMTEHPRVVEGMIDIFGGWIERFGIDGFRIDTARHVNPEFWQAFVPAMLDRARTRGVPNFHIFGEVALHSLDAGGLARFTRVDKLPAVLDFAFREAVVQTVAGTSGTNAFETLFDGDALYEHGFDTALTLPTFTGNHDDGRFGFQLRRAFPQASDAELLERTMLANAMLLTLRGVPTIYSGDEQGFTGDGGDQGSREDMFASEVASYNDNTLLGSDATTAEINFDTAHPLFRQIAELARIRTGHAALTRGRQVLRARGDTPGLLAISRFDPASGREMLLVFNTSTKTMTQQVQVETASSAFAALAGTCAPTASAPGSVAVTLPPLGYAICQAQ